MHLHGEFVGRKQELDEQWEAVFEDGGRSNKIALELAGDVTQGSPGQRAVRDATVAPGEPAFADGLLHDLGIDGTQVAYAPRALVEDRDQQEWVEVGHRAVEGKTPHNPKQGLCGAPAQF